VAKSVCAGTPEEVAECAESYTGQALAPVPGRSEPQRKRGSKRPARNGKPRETIEEITHLRVEGRRSTI